MDVFTITRLKASKKLFTKWYFVSWDAENFENNQYFACIYESNTYIGKISFETVFSEKRVLAKT